MLCMICKLYYLSIIRYIDSRIKINWYANDTFIITSVILSGILIASIILLMIYPVKSEISFNEEK